MPRKTTDPKLAVAYLRVSTEDQNLGPEAQQALINQWAKANGVEVNDIFLDHGISGAAPLDERPALLAALECLEDIDAGVLVVAKRDRLARDIVVASMIERLVEKAGARILCADGASNAEGPEGQLMKNIQDVFAQYERALIRARTKAALAVKKGRNEVVGQVPYGYVRVEGATEEAPATLAPNSDEQVNIRIMQALRKKGYGYRRIAEYLDSNFVEARGVRWHATTVRRCLERATKD